MIVKQRNTYLISESVSATAKKKIMHQLSFESDSSFCSTNSQKLKDSSFTITTDKKAGHQYIFDGKVEINLLSKCSWINNLIIAALVKTTMKKPVSHTLGKSASEH